MESLKKLSENVFSKKSEQEPSTANKGTFSSVVYVIGILVLVALAYYFRDKVYSAYQTYVAESVRRFVGENLLKMNLSPNGEFMSTYVPDLSSLVGSKPSAAAESASAAVKTASANLQEITLDEIGV